MATNYSIHTGAGDEICAGIQMRNEAVRIAQGHADRRGESVWLTDGGDEDPEEVGPTNAAITFEVCEAPSQATLGSILLTCSAWLTEADGVQVNGPEAVYLLRSPLSSIDYPEARDAAVSFARAERVHGFLWEVTGDDSSRRLYSIREDGRWYAIT